jgi:hypothetical protein
MNPGRITSRLYFVGLIDERPERPLFFAAGFWGGIWVVKERLIPASALPVAVIRLFTARV